MSDKRPIIIIKKKISHAGHHGGAWKVAYADFVTAMMALFIVLWLTSSGEKVKKSIASYFNDPAGTMKELGTGKDGTGDSIPLDKKGINELKEKMERQIASRPELSKLHNQVDIIITPEGMRVELMESKDGTFFQTGSSTLNPLGKSMLSLLARELSTAPNRVSIEGHTDAQPYGGESRYDNWELSTDRANAARRLMQATGLQLNQLAQVRGFADQQLRLPASPLDPSNRRISVIVHYAGFNQLGPGSKSAIALANQGAGKPASQTVAGSGPARAAGGSVSRSPASGSAAAGSNARAGETAATEPAPPVKGSEGSVVKTGLAAKPSLFKGLLSKLPTSAGAAAWARRTKASMMPHKAAKAPAPPVVESAAK